MIAILGGQGYIGSAYRRYLESRNLSVYSVSRSVIDYTDRDTLLNFLREAKPDFLINTAGYTGTPNVDACEDNKATCLFGNAVLPGVISEACAASGTLWGHVSSGCIFAGKRTDGMGFNETDMPNFTFRQDNCSFYSGTKALGEEVLASASWCYIWRLRIPFDEFEHSRNYLTKMMRYAVLLDAENSLSHLGDFVRATISCWEQRIPFGTYNVTNPGSVTTREVVRRLQSSGICDREPRYFESIEEFMATAARTPRSNCVLDSRKLLNAGVRLPEIHESLDTALSNWQPSLSRS